MDEIYSRLVRPNKDVLEFVNGICDGPTRTTFLGNKKLNRSRRYSSNITQWTELTFRRFMYNGVYATGGRMLASGVIAEFKIDKNVWEFLETDRSDGKISEEQYDRYKSRMEQFEKDVNKLVYDKYCR